MKFVAVAAACVLALLVTSPGGASVPGNMKELANEGLLHVCRDVEPGHAKYVVCDDQVDPFDPQSAYTGSECVAAGLQPICRIDQIPGVQLPGSLVLIGDEHPLDGFGDPFATFDELGNPVSHKLSTMILELKYDWKKITLIEAFGGTKIGNWNAFFELDLINTDDVFDYTDEGAFQFTNGNLVELGLRIRDLAQQYYPHEDLTNAVPILVSVVRDSNRLPVDAATFDDELASAAYYRVVVRFARVRP